MPRFTFFPVPPAATPSPLFVQGVGSDLNDNNGITGNAFQFNLPNNTLAGNTIILTVSYPYSATRTLVITDSAGDTWPSLASSITTGTTSVGNMRVTTFALQNASSGFHQITATFDTAIKPFQYTMAEFYNVGAVDGSHGANNVAGTTAAAGSYTPTTPNDAHGGHLIWTYAISNDTVGTALANQASAIAKTGGTSPLFMHANNICTIPQASSYDTQLVNGAINPGFNFTQSSGTNFVVQSVALLASAVGTAPSAGIRVKRILHYSNVNPQNGTNNIICPCDGNLRLVTMAAGDNLNLLNSVSDSGGTYTARAASGNSQVFDLQNATPSNGLVVNMSLNGAGQPQYSMRFFDVVGAQASSFLNTQGFNGSAPASGNVTTAGIPNITPNAAPGLTVCVTGWGTGPTKPPVSSPSGAIYDIVYYTGETDQDRMDNADGSGHLYYSTTAAQAWNWNFDNAARGSTLFATACCYQ